MSNVFRPVSLVVAFSVVGSCGGSPAASWELLVGTWIVDFDRTWDLSRDAFMKDTLRGAGAYPDDEAEKVAIVRREMEEFLAGKGFAVGSANEISTTIGDSASGSCEVLAAEGTTIRLSVDLGRKQEMDVEFIERDLVRWRIKGRRGDMLLVLRRK